MKGSDFTQDSEVQQVIQKLKQDMDGRLVSDVTCGKGHQYVDLVMEGGGVLGIALLGYTYVLEEVGIRFLDIGGTSAGSIGALLLAAAGTKDEPKSERVATALANQDLSQFMDSGPWGRRFLQAAMGKAWVRAGIYYVGARRDFVKHLGFNPGDAFLEWMQETLRGYGIETTRDLKKRMQYRPKGFAHQEGKELSEEIQKAELAMITAEVLTETKVQFPGMAELFWEDHEELNPAFYVRASMSVPYFFHPFRVMDLPQGPEAEKRWADKANYESSLPEEALFIDGGIMSNFPIDVFHNRNSIPTCPTFGIKLGKRKRKAQEVKRPHELGLAMFHAARHCLDYDFIHRNPDYEHLLGYIDTGDHNWLDFDLERDAKIDLFRRGAEAAGDFLRDFDWLHYRSIRAELAKTHKLAKTKASNGGGGAKPTGKGELEGSLPSPGGVGPFCFHVSYEPSKHPGPLFV